MQGKDNARIVKECKIPKRVLKITILVKKTLSLTPSLRLTVHKVGTSYLHRF
jgi:hypothetical protein